MTVENEDDLMKLRLIGRIVFETLMLMKKHLKPGISTLELDRIGQQHLEKFGARSAPILMYDFPGHTCISINNEAAHGIPSERKVEPGDVVNIDVSAELGGFFGDTGGTFPVAPVEPRIDYLCQMTKKSLKAAMKVATAGAKINEIGRAIETTAHQAGFTTIKDLGSHGIGRSLHEEPHFIPNFHDLSDKRQLKEGQVITIEPFLSITSESTRTAADGWTLLTEEGNYSAQYEYTMVITRDQPVVLTTLSA
ncbi:MAG: type I methionyl aminopeptidase [Gammaproteobacteria bacterium]|nr:type I methionyl aminopeptidase [Gammaproteobacteria bacterium]MBT4491597.1 type I methionyl aminopeptidase [Gammaproteobacteria bacterium]